MEQATIARPPLGAQTELPPGSGAPSLLQALRYVRDPLGFLVQLQRRYGDIFTLSFPFFGRLVYVADPALVKTMFTGSPEQFHAGEANATVLGPALGPNSVLTLDDAPHMQQRKLLLPPFHGERVRSYGELIRETTRKQMETWPVGEPFALRPHTQRITLAVIIAVQIAFPLVIRPNLISPVRSTSVVTAAAIDGLSSNQNGTLVQVQAQSPNIPGAWIYSSDVVDKAGSTNLGALPSSCPGPNGGGNGGGPQECFQALAAKHLKQVTVYQPADRYWTFQALEFGIYLTVAILLAWACFWWTRRRLS